MIKIFALCIYVMERSSKIILHKKKIVFRVGTDIDDIKQELRKQVESIWHDKSPVLYTVAYGSYSLEELQKGLQPCVDKLLKSAVIKDDLINTIEKIQTV